MPDLNTTRTHNPTSSICCRKLMFIFSFAVTAVLCCSKMSAQQASKTEAKDRVVQVQMNNVMYHVGGNAVVHLRRVGGELVPTKADGIPVFDDKNSFSLRLAAAEMAISPQSMASVLNQYVFSGKDSPIREVSITLENNLMKVKGKLHNKADISFETDSSVSVTADGKIRLHAEKIRALHLPAKGLMDLFGVEIADLIKNGKVSGVTAEKDDLIIDPEKVFPPPKIQGRVSAVQLSNGNIVLTFGSWREYQWARVDAKNYMWYHGNRLQFGKLTMHDTDLLLVDPDPRDPFDFDLGHYKEQLMAGYSKTTATFGLRTTMVDYNKLKSRAKK
ncbi:MAG TPA: hypothetical protein VFR08_08525 [Candidatus Angelobacter sp.]|nr:hypothetical protein [Candidatus Angelobacter sp.]